MSEWPCTSLHLSCTQTPTLNHTARAHRIHTAGSASRSSDPPTHMVLWMCQYNSGSYHKQFESSRNSCEKQWNTRVRNHEYLLHASSSGSSIRPALLYRQYPRKHLPQIEQPETIYLGSVSLRRALARHANGTFSTA